MKLTEAVLLLACVLFGGLIGERLLRRQVDTAAPPTASTPTDVLSDGDEKLSANMAEKRA